MGWSRTSTTAPSWPSTVTTAASASRSLPSMARSESCCYLRFSRLSDLQQSINAARPLRLHSVLLFSFVCVVRVVTLQAESRKDCEEVKCFLVMLPALCVLLFSHIVILLLPPSVDLHHQQHLQEDLPERERRGLCATSLINTHLPGYKSKYIQYIYIIIYLFAISDLPSYSNLSVWTWINVLLSM